MTEKELFEQTVKELEYNQRRRDMERIRVQTGAEHCPICGQPIQNCRQCPCCGFQNS